MNKTKQLGTVGELKVASELTRLGYFVFTELGDNAPMDLIAVQKDTGTLTRIQVKTCNSRNGTVTVSLVNSTHSYNRKYREDDFDYFAIYAVKEDKIAYIKLEDVMKNSKVLTLRLETTKNNQTKNVNWFNDFLDIPII